MSQRLEQIKARDLTILEGTKLYDDFLWLIKQAEIHQETEQTWANIEGNEVEIEPEDFYSVYQDIALKQLKGVLILEQREIYFYSFDDNQPYRYLGENDEFINCEYVISGNKREFAKDSKSKKNYMFINKKQLNNILEYLTQ